MKPIETIYKSLRYRSRLEARWSIVFDTMGIEFEYEKEGYDLGDGLFYLPDFFIPHLKCWIEIKGEREYNGKKMDRLAEHTGYPVYVFCGQIPNPDTLEPSGPPYRENQSAFIHFGGWDLHHVWCQCPDCGAFGIEFDARTDRLQCKKNGCPKHGLNDDKGYNGDSEQLKLAYSAGRKARFEYGK